jgi:hypothetical protein
LKTQDLINQLFRLFGNNYKKRREKEWVCKNMQEKNMQNTKKFLINKKEENRMFKSNTKGLIVKLMNNNNK